MQYRPQASCKFSVIRGGILTQKESEMNSTLAGVHCGTVQPTALFKSRPASKVNCRSYYVILCRRNFLSELGCGNGIWLLQICDISPEAILRITIGKFEAIKMIQSTCGLFHFLYMLKDGNCGSWLSLNFNVYMYTTSSTMTVIPLSYYRLNLPQRAKIHSCHFEFSFIYARSGVFDGRIRYIRIEVWQNCPDKNRVVW